MICSYFVYFRPKSPKLFVKKLVWGMLFFGRSFQFQRTLQVSAMACSKVVDPGCRQPVLCVGEIYSLLPIIN